MGCDVGYGLLHRIPRRKSERENTVADDTVSYSDTIFNAPEYPDDELEEAKQTLLPPSPILTQQDDQPTSATHQD